MQYKHARQECAPGIFIETAVIDKEKVESKTLVYKIAGSIENSKLKSATQEKLNSSNAVRLINNSRIKNYCIKLLIAKFAELVAAKFLFIYAKADKIITFVQMAHTQLYRGSAKTSLPDKAVE